ncbi:MAG: hypothetical protein HQL36_04110 [Alphaproteobacteria bacterium]|nr:hypothetical protein [Alphaproteobacteria bacterium]MBF0250799.1 hypothetical protein [Alphaproteobacteria bacterium]
MNGVIIAINIPLGVLIAETPDHRCVQLTFLSRVDAQVGDELDGDWDALGPQTVSNVTRGTDLQLKLRATDLPRAEAVGSVTVV